jgi:endonuclease G, mitochondrial
VALFYTYPDYTPFKLFQVKIAEIERLTGLSFVYGKEDRSLTECDPLETARLPRRGRFSSNESVGMAAVPSGYVELMELDDIIL